MPTTDTHPASLLCVGLASTTMDNDIRSLLDRGVGGVILFARNVESPQQVAQLCCDLKRYANRPLLIMIDHEGGATVRLREGFTCLPSMRALGRTGDVQLARQVGAIIGSELKAVGIDFALAPVMDVDSNPDNPVIGPRSLSADPGRVAQMGCALIAGIQSQGVAACAKHFPGHGDTAQDSHLDLPHLPHDMARLEQIELLPFRAATQANVAAIMSAHIVFEAIDSARPATLSRAVLQGVLRERIGYEGVLISDCMEMKAIADPDNHGGDAPPREHVPAAVVAGIAAGLDLALVSHTAELAHAAIDRLEEQVTNGRAFASRIKASQERVTQMMASYVAQPNANPGLLILGCDAHQKIISGIADDGDCTDDPTLAIGG